MSGSKSLNDWEKRINNALDIHRWMPGTKKKPPSIYANFNERVFASIIDTIASTFVFGPILIPISAKLYGNERQTDISIVSQSSPDQALDNLIALFAKYMGIMVADISLHYFILGAVVLFFWMYASATPGKWLLRMRIVDEHTYCKPTNRQFFIRYLGYIPIMLLLTLPFLLIPFDRKRQGWHDKMAGTVVVKVKHWRLKDDGTIPHIASPQPPEAAIDNAE